MLYELEIFRHQLNSEYDINTLNLQKMAVWFLHGSDNILP